MSIRIDRNKEAKFSHWPLNLAVQVLWVASRDSL